MDKVIYRDLCEKDYERIKELICEAFRFNEFINDRKFLDSILTRYLQGCILSSSFSKVAERDNKIIGIILGEAKSDKNRLAKFHNNLSFISAELKLVISNKENRKIFKEFSRIHKVYDEIIQGKKRIFKDLYNYLLCLKNLGGLVLEKL